MVTEPLPWPHWARYNQHFNRQLYAAVGTLSAEERRADRGAFFGSVHGTLAHLVVADALWLHRVGALHTAPAAEGPWPGPAPETLRLDLDAWPDFEDLKRARTWLDLRLLAWIDALQAEDLAAPVTYQALGGAPHTHPLWWVVAHVFNHQAHHRGQVTTLLSQAGVDVGVTDLMVYLRRHP